MAAASLSKFKQRLALVADLDAIGPTGVWLEGVPAGKVAHFAGEARVADAADMRKVGTDKQLTLLAGFVYTVATGVRDDVVTMFYKRIAAIHKRGRDNLEALREAHRAESERLLGEFGEVLAAAREVGSDAAPPDAAVPGAAVPGAGVDERQAGWCSRRWSRRVGWRRVGVTGVHLRPVEDPSGSGRRVRLRIPFGSARRWARINDGPRGWTSSEARVAPNHARRGSSRSRLQSIRNSASSKSCSACTSSSSATECVNWPALGSRTATSRPTTSSPRPSGS
ncbi:hypothetical protein AB0C87_33825 [Actinomadura sp. NPDC048021]|uniref:hypothetical protein n=1 Tax=Actinomadura sp. NPDC048021 TaxID=3155385 RepID=UPI0033EE3349